MPGYGRDRGDLTPGDRVLAAETLPDHVRMLVLHTDGKSTVWTRGDDGEWCLLPVDRIAYHETAATNDLGEWTITIPAHNVHIDHEHLDPPDQGDEPFEVPSAYEQARREVEALQAAADHDPNPAAHLSVILARELATYELLRHDDWQLCPAHQPAGFHTPARELAACEHCHIPPDVLHRLQAAQQDAHPTPPDTNGRREGNES